MKVEIKKVTQGAYCGPNNFGHNWTSADTISRTHREIYVNGELHGSMEKEDGQWWVELDLGIRPFFLTASLRSLAKAEAEILARIEEATFYVVSRGRFRNTVHEVVASDFEEAQNMLGETDLDVFESKTDAESFARYHEEETC